MMVADHALLALTTFPLSRLVVKSFFPIPFGRDSNER